MKKIVNSFLSAVLVLMLLISLMPLSAFAVEDAAYVGQSVGEQPKHSHEGWTAWGDSEAEKTSLPAEVGQYYLTSDIELSATWEVRVREMELCLNGHAIRLTAESGAVISLHDNGKLSIYDCGTNERYFKCVNGGLWEDAGTKKPGGTVIALEDYDRSTANGTYVKTTGGVITGGKQSGVFFDDYYPCEFHLYGGNIVGNSNAGSYGGGIEARYGGVFMYGGSVAGNTAKCGGGIATYFNQSMYYYLIPALDCQIEGGCITGNTATNGGGIYGSHNSTTELSGSALVNGNRCSSYGGGVYTAGLLDMKGGTVSGNKSDLNGGGLYANADGSIVISDGTVCNNSAKNGGGVYDNNDMTLSGGVITGNSASGAGGGIRLGNVTDSQPEARTLTVTGGTVSKNSAKNGGGIYVGVGAEMKASDFTVTENKATGYGGGIDIDTDGAVTLNGGSVTNNTAGFGAGGVCFAGDKTVIGGLLKVTDNTVGGKAGNLLVNADQAITLAEGDDALKDGAIIGISLQKAAENSNSERRFTANGAKTDEQFFTADDTSLNFGPFYNEEGYLDIVVLHLHEDADGSLLNFKEWTDSTKLPDGGEWYLGTDVTLKRDWQPTKDTKLCLNGHVISTANESCLWLEEVNLDLYDETDSAVHYFRYNKGSAWTYLGDSASEKAVSLSDFSLKKVSDGDVIAVPGGVITGFDMFLNVYSDLATEPQVHFNMFGGNIVGIESDYFEPVSIQGDVTFNMYGGSVAGNLFPYGDIILNRLGSMNILGGIVTGNIASGAIVKSESESGFTVAGSAEIHDNVSEKGAVCAGATDVVMGGSAQVCDNATAKGAVKNVYLDGGRKIVVASPEEGMSVGVSLKTAPTAEKPVQFSTKAAPGDAEFFFSDGGYAVKYRPADGSADALYLAEASGLASIFGEGNVWLIAALAAVVAAGIVTAAVICKKKKSGGEKAE